MATGLMYFLVLFTVIGALNAAVAGLIGFNALSTILGLFVLSWLKMVVFGIIGLSAIILAYKELKRI